MPQTYPSGDWETITASTAVPLIADTWTTIPNDGLGGFTNKAYKPDGSVVELMDTSTGAMAFAYLQKDIETLRKENSRQDIELKERKIKYESLRVSVLANDKSNALIFQSFQSMKENIIEIKDILKKMNNNKTGTY